MAQSNLKVDPNGDGRSLISDIEEGFKALATSSSGPGEPVETNPFMPWADTDSGLMKQRNSSDTGWIIVGPLDTPGFGLGMEVGDYVTSARTSKDRCLLCDGREVSRATYSELFAEIGEQFGSGDGVTTFNLPGPQGKAIVYPGDGGTALTNRTIGQTFGSETHRQSVAEMAQHTHTVPRRSTGTEPNPKRAVFADSDGQGYVASEDGLVNLSGQGKPFNIMQPSIVVGRLFIRALP